MPQNFTSNRFWGCSSQVLLSVACQFKMKLQASTTFPSLNDLPDHFLTHLKSYSFCILFYFHAKMPTRSQKLFLKVKISCLHLKLYCSQYIPFTILGHDYVLDMRLKSFDNLDNFCWVLRFDKLYLIDIFDDFSQYLLQLLIIH